MTTRIDGIANFANRLADVLYGYLAEQAISKVDILFSRSVAGAIRIDRHSLLPIDFTRFAQPQKALPPLITLAPELLLERLAAEYVYAQLCEAANACLRCRERRANDRHGGGQKQYGSKTCHAAATSAAATPGRDHDRDH